MSDTLAGVIIGGLLAMAGGFLQSLLAARAVDRQLAHSEAVRLREARQKAYEPFLEASENVINAIGYEIEDGQMIALLDKLSLAADRVLLVAPNDTCRAMDEFMYELLRDAKDDRRPSVETKVKRPPLLKLLRRDLGVDLARA